MNERKQLLQHVGAGTVGAILMSCFLIAGLIASGCSRQKTTPTSSTTSATSSAAPATNPASSPVTASEATQKPAPNKVARKRPSTVIYRDQTYGLSFRYPRKYVLKSGDGLKNVESAGMNFVQPGGATAVLVEMPKNAYPGTDLTSAFLRINISKALTASECEQFAIPRSSPSEGQALDSPKIQLGETELQGMENITGEAGKQAETKYFHLFANNACYELAVGLTTESDGSGELAPVDREDVFRRLEKILAGVKIKPEATPAVAAGALTSPAIHQEEAK